MSTEIDIRDDVFLLKSATYIVDMARPAHTHILIEYKGYGFNRGFGFKDGFKAIPSRTKYNMSGGFNKGFGLGFKAKRGGGFPRDAFTKGFNRVGNLNSSP